MVKHFIRLLMYSLIGISAESSVAGYDLDRLGVPQFVNTNYIDLTRIFQISKFRSGAGHDYSDDVEKCRSMKHYFMTPDATTSIWSPVAGTVSLLRDDFVGTQVLIQSDLQPDFTFIIFHVALAKPLIVGEHITEGQLLGNHVGLQTFSDIAVGVNASNGYRLVSYFETLTTAAFEPFRARGITAPSELIITRAQRDASPFNCSGQEFVSSSPSPYIEYVMLTGGAGAPVVSRSILGPISSQMVILSMALPANVTNMVGSVFVAAALPPAMGGDIYLLSRSAGWMKFDGCDSALAALQGMLFSGIGANVVPEPADLSAYAGTTLYIGYGIGSTSAGACAQMLGNMSFAPAYTIN